jgi:diguanylate cyclase (GGDEF)-like protein
MNISKKAIDAVLRQLKKFDLWNIDIKEIGSALNKGLGGSGYAIFSCDGKKTDLKYHEGTQEKKLLQQIKKSKNTLAFDFKTDREEYKFYILTKEKLNLTKGQYASIHDVLSILANAISIRQVSKDRIIETQIINELNLNVTTTLEENKIVKNLESAARRMLGTENINMYYLMNDKLISPNNILEIASLHRDIYGLLFNKKQIFTLTRKYSKFLRLVLADKNIEEITFVPFTIKNEFRGFFMIYDDIISTKRSFALTRLKFLANQAALALERIELFRALNNALKESEGLQEVTRVMLSTLDLSSFFTEILQRAQKLLRFKRLLFSLYNRHTKCFDRINGVGISARILREAKKIHPPLSVVNSLLQNRYRISNSFYIPTGEADRHVRQYVVYKNPITERKLENLWTPGDFLISPIYSKNRELVALLSLDQPVDNLVPSINKIRLLETFGDFLGLAIENAQLFEKIEKLSVTDELTSVYNYRFLREKMKSVVRRNVSPTTLIMIDIDAFKKYNDKFGHLYGDEVLRIFSGALTNVVKDDGFVIRYGGDEFIILLPKTDRMAAKEFVKKLTKYVRRHKLIKGRLTIAFSHGLAVYPSDSANLGELIDHADSMLYKEKSKKYHHAKT